MMSDEEHEDRPWFKLTGEETLEALDAERGGLDSDEAESRLDRYGPNTIRSDRKVSAWSVLLHQFASPLVYVLLAALVVTLGIQAWSDAIAIGMVLLLNGTIGFIQEYRAETAVQSLMEMVSPKARIRRDGEEREVDGDDLVPGDCVLLGEGGMVPADLRLLDASSLQIDESALTGESVPATKTDETMRDADENLPPADQATMAFMGTAVTAGHAEGVVVATGRRTELGRIAEDIREAGDIDTPLQQRMDRLAKWIGVGILVVAAIAFFVGLGMGRDTIQMLLLGVSLAVAAIPEGLPVVMTVALAIGVRRMARQNAVIRNLPAVETLGSTTVIISDKTGTLTQNRMTVTQVAAGGEGFEVTGGALSAEGEFLRNGGAVAPEEGSALHDTLLAGFLNNTAELEEAKPEREKDAADENGAADEAESDADFEQAGDPMEVALLISAVKGGLDRGELGQRYPRVDEVPFRTERRFSATIHETPDGEEGPLVLIKGAPEVVVDMCGHRKAADGNVADLDREEVRKQYEELASRGLRVLAMASGRGRSAAESIKSEQPSGMTLAGMQGLMDPPRPEAAEAVDSCHRSGIRVIMVTGDHPRTAAAIAREVHVDRPVRNGDEGSRGETDPNGEDLPEVRTGRDVAEMSDEELDEVLEKVNVFARVRPDQKLRIVERLKARNQIVAVTGDGVNDAPALKSAHLGAAMGETGTDVAKEASDMVITDDNFASVYSAVEQGRTAFRNIRMATFFLLSTGAADVMVILWALAARWELPLLPAQILWCNVVTNGIADVALGFEPGEKALYDRRPRPPREGVLNRMLIERLVVVGIWLSAGTLGVFWWVEFHRGDGLDLARTAALTTLVLFQMVHVFNCRSEDVSIFKKNLFGNKVLLLGVLASLALHVGALYLPATQKVLSVQPLSWEIWLAAAGVAATAIVVNELHKRLRPREKFESAKA
ncbi:MAG: HAD-IC family P-type ATPase [Verrucomicrobiales bacterium]